MTQTVQGVIAREKGAPVEVVDIVIPEPGPNEVLIRVNKTAICGTDVHILKGEYPVAKGLTIGHEPVGIIEKLGSNVEGYTEGQRVIAGAICACAALACAKAPAPRWR